MSNSRFQLHLLGAYVLRYLGASQLTVKGMEVNTGIITEVKTGKGEGEREEPAGKSTTTGIHHAVMKENMMGMTEEKEVDMKVSGGLLVNITSSFVNAWYFGSDFPNQKQVGSM